MICKYPIQILFSLILIATTHCLCPLNKFPNQFYSSNRLTSQINIDQYIDTQFPVPSSDLTHPFKIVQNYSNIDFNKIIPGSAHSLVVIPTLHKTNLTLQIFNVTKNTKIKQYKFNLNYTMECKFIISDYSVKTYENIILGVFAMCFNTTHRMPYAFIDLYTKQQTQPRVSFGILSKRDNYTDFYLAQSKNQDHYPIIDQIDCAFTYQNQTIVQVYWHRSANLWITISKQDSIIKRNQIIRFYVFNYVYCNGMRVFLTKDNGIVFYNNEYDRIDQWNIKNQKLLNITVFCDNYRIAILGQTNIYILQIQNPKSDNFKGYYKQIAKIQRKQKLNNIQFFTVGKYIIQKNGIKWKAYYLNNQDRLIQFLFDFETYNKSIVIDHQFCYSNSIFINNSRYVLQTMKIKNEGQKRSIILSTSQCNKTIQLIRLNNTIQQINIDKDILYKNGQLIVNNVVFIGDSVTTKIDFNGISYPIPRYTQYDIQIEGEVIEFLEIQVDKYLLLTKTADKIIYYMCVQQCKNVYQLNIGVSIIKGIQFKLLKRKHINNNNLKIPSDLAIIAISLNQTTIFNYFHIQKQNAIHYLTKRYPLSRISLSSIFSIIDYTQIVQNSDLNYFIKESTLKLLTDYPYIIDSFSHLQLAISQFDQQSIGHSYYSDLQRGYTKICSIGRNNFVLSRLQQNGLVLTHAINKIPNFYIVMQSRLFSQFINSKIICLKQTIGIIINDSFIQLNENFETVSNIKIVTNKNEDLANQNLYIHKNSQNITQIYDAKTGFLLNSFTIPISLIKISKQSNSIIINNSKIINFNFLPSKSRVSIFKDDDRLFLYGFNNYSSTSRLKTVKIIQTLNLPTQQIINLKNTEFIDDFWNCTVNSVQILQSDKSIEKSQISHFDKFQLITPIRRNDNLTMRVQKINGKNIVFQFQSKWADQLKSWDVSYLDIVFQSKKINYYNQQIPLFGITNLIDQKLYSLWKNMSGILIHQYIINLINQTSIKSKTIFYPTITYTQLDFNFQLRTFTDGKYIYILRYKMKDWNSTFKNDAWSSQFHRPYRFVNRNQSYYWTIQILSINQPFSIVQIDEKSYNLTQKLIDFLLININKVSYLIILFESKLIIQSYPKKQKQICQFSLTNKFIKFQFNEDKIYLISPQNDHQVARINWSFLWTQKMLQFQNKMISVGQDSIIDAKIVNNMLITISPQNMYIYHANTNKDSYSVQKISVNKIKGNYTQPYALQRLSIVSETQLQIVMLDKRYNGNWGISYQLVALCQISPKLNIKQARRIILTNNAGSKQYSVKINSIQNLKKEKLKDQ